MERWDVERPNDGGPAAGRPVGRAKSSLPVVPIIIGAAVVVVIALAAAWYFVWSVVPPVEVAKKYDAARAKMDFAVLKTCVRESDQADLAKLEQAVKKMGALAKMAAAMTPTYTYGETTYGEDGKATVQRTAKLPAVLVQYIGRPELETPCLLVKEGREWRVDIKATERAAADAIPKDAPIFQQNAPAVPGM